VCRNVFEATLFLLGAHAYDVGDMLDIEGTMYRVSKITLLYTVRTPVTRTPASRCPPDPVLSQ
jgi:small-conductance mechanosensitive channel